jgi:hypothetical protein
MNTSRGRIDVDVEELGRVIDAAENGPLSKADRQKLKTTLHALLERLAQKRNTEKTNSVLEPKNASSPAAASPEPPAPAGHGPNAASAFTGADKVCVQHAQLKPGDPCLECREGKIYRQKEPKTLISTTLCGGCRATGIPTATRRCFRLRDSLWIFG